MIKGVRKCRIGKESDQRGKELTKEVRKAILKDHCFNTVVIIIIFILALFIVFMLRGIQDLFIIEYCRIFLSRMTLFVCLLAG